MTPPTASPSVDGPRTGGRDREYEHLEPLLAVFASLPEGHPERDTLRQRLATGYLPVVQHIARRYSGRGEPTDDLEQIGSIGLLHALDRYDPDVGVPFLAYAVPTITGEMRRHFRDRAWAVRVPRRLKEIGGSLGPAISTLSQELGRAPRPSEIAAHLDVPIEDVIDGLQAREAYNGRSLDEPMTADGLTLADVVGESDAGIGLVDDRESLGPLLDELPERERTILLLRFFGGMTQTQIADRVGISQMHVSRLLSQTLANLRQRLTQQD